MVFEPMALTPEQLLYGYQHGLFPMAESRNGQEIFWCFPKKRGILPLESFHIPKKLERLFHKHPFEIKVDTAFAEVIHACAEPTEMRPESWINAEIEHAYNSLFHQGYAHSVECWKGKKLVGGLYGVSLGGAFFGESMFSRVPNASKIALVTLVLILKEGGYTLLDTQYVNSHLRQFGAKEISSEVYKGLLHKALQHPARFTLQT